MRYLVAAILILTTACAGAHELHPKAYPSCNLMAQHALAGELGGSIKDTRQAHISVRANILQADIGNARKARHLTQAKADRLWKRVETIRQASNAFTVKQGFLSAAENASYDRELDAIARQVCGSS